MRSWLLIASVNAVLCAVLHHRAQFLQSETGIPHCCLGGVQCLSRYDAIAQISKKMHYDNLAKCGHLTFTGRPLQQDTQVSSFFILSYHINTLCLHCMRVHSMVNFMTQTYHVTYALMQHTAMNQMKSVIIISKNINGPRLFVRIVSCRLYDEARTH